MSNISATSFTAQLENQSSCYEFITQANRIPAMDTKDDFKAIESARLQAIYRARRREDPSITQSSLADAFGFAGQSAISQFLNGRIPLNLENLLKFSTVLRFRPSEVSPRLVPQGSDFDIIPSGSRPADVRASDYEPEIPGIAGARRRRLETEENGLELSPIEQWDDGTPLQADEVELPFYKEVEISAGDGSEVILESGGRKLRFARRTLQKKGIAPDNAACATVRGNSMEPVLPDGSTIGIDRDGTTIVDGQIYAIDHDGQLRVKVLYLLPGQGLRLRSFNTSEYPDELYDRAYASQHIRVIGKVFWYSVLL